MKKLITLSFFLMFSCSPEKLNNRKDESFVYIFRFPEGVSESSQDLVRSHVYFDLPGENLSGQNFSQIEESFLSSRITISYFKDGSGGVDRAPKEEEIISYLKESGVREDFTLEIIMP